MIRFIQSIYFLTCCSFLAFSQGIVLDNPLPFYADVMVNASESTHRSYAGAKFQENFEKRVMNASSFEDELNELPWIFVRYDEDKTFRFISWQVETGEEEYGYQVYFQKKGAIPIKLKGTAALDRRAEYVGDQIYRAIIHDIQSFEGYYLISSFTLSGGKKAQKIVDVMNLDNDIPVFGKPIFYENENVPEGRGHKRIILNYSSIASASMNINIGSEENSIVYDHIIEVPGKLEGEGMMSVPDGTYEAYIHKGPQKWVYVSNLYKGLEYIPKSSSGPRKKN